MTVLFAVLLVCATNSFCAMTAGDLAITGSVIGSGGGSGEAGGEYGLYSVSGQSTSGGTSETSEYSMKAGNIYTLTGVSIETTGAPTMEWVRINNIPFKSGDIISSKAEILVRLLDEQGISTIELYVDSSAAPVLFALDPHSPPATTFEGTWVGNLTIHQPGTHALMFYACDGGGHGKYYNMKARIMGGKVQVVGQVYNYPNPFSPMSGGTTNIQYTLSTDAAITILIYDITGHEVKRMKYGSGSPGGRGGTNQVVWNGQSIGGEIAGNGMYIYKIISGDQVIGSGKLVIFD